MSMTSYTPEELRAQARRMLDVPQGLAVQRGEPDFYFNLGAGAAMLEVAAEQIENLEGALRANDKAIMRAVEQLAENNVIMDTAKEKIELTEKAYGASLELQSTLLERATHFQKEFYELKETHQRIAVNQCRTEAAHLEKIRKLEELVKRQRQVIDTHEIDGRNRAAP